MFDDLSDADKEALDDAFCQYFDTIDPISTDHQLVNWVRLLRMRHLLWRDSIDEPFFPAIAVDPVTWEKLVTATRPGPDHENGDPVYAWVDDRLYVAAESFPTEQFLESLGSAELDAEYAAYQTSPILELIKQ